MCDLVRRLKVMIDDKRKGLYSVFGRTGECTMQSFPPLIPPASGGKIASPLGEGRRRGERKVRAYWKSFIFFLLVFAVLISSGLHSGRNANARADNNDYKLKMEDVNNWERLMDKIVINIPTFNNLIAEDENAKGEKGSDKRYNNFKKKLNKEFSPGVYYALFIKPSKASGKASDQVEDVITENEAQKLNRAIFTSEINDRETSEIAKSHSPEPTPTTTPTPTILTPNDVTKKRYLLKVKSIKNWVTFLVSLKQTEGDPCKKRVNDFLNDGSKKIINSYQTDEDIDDSSKKTIIDGFNKILMRKDFYDKSTFSKLILNSKGKKLLNKKIENLTDDEILMLNRLTLEAIFPIEKIQKWINIKTIIAIILLVITIGIILYYFILKSKKYPFLNKNDISDWQKLRDKIKPKEKLSIERVYQEFGKKAQFEISTSQPIEKLNKKIIINGLNKIIENQDFYSPKSFTDTEIPPHITNMINLKNKGELSKKDIYCLNRNLLELIFQGIIRSEKTKKKEPFLHHVMSLFSSSNDEEETSKGIKTDSRRTDFLNAYDNISGGDEEQEAVSSKTTKQEKASDTREMEEEKEEMELPDFNNLSGRDIALINAKEISKLRRELHELKEFLKKDHYIEVGGPRTKSTISPRQKSTPEKTALEKEPKLTPEEIEKQNIINFINSKDVVDIKESRKLEEKTDRYDKWNAQLKLISTNEGPKPELKDNKPIIIKLNQGPFWIWKMKNKLYVFTNPGSHGSIADVNLDNCFTEDGKSIKRYAAGEYIEIIEPAICEEVREGKEWLLVSKGKIRIHQDNSFRNGYSYIASELKKGPTKVTKIEEEPSVTSGGVVPTRGVVPPGEGKAPTLTSQDIPAGDRFSATSGKTNATQGYFKRKSRKQSISQHQDLGLLSTYRDTEQKPHGNSFDYQQNFPDDEITEAQEKRRKMYEYGIELFMIPPRTQEEKRNYKTYFEDLNAFRAFVETTGTIGNIEINALKRGDSGFLLVLPLYKNKFEALYFPYYLTKGDILPSEFKRAFEYDPSVFNIIEAIKELKVTDPGKCIFDNFSRKWEITKKCKLSVYREVPVREIQRDYNNKGTFQSREEIDIRSAIDFFKIKPPHKTDEYIEYMIRYDKLRKLFKTFTCSFSDAIITGRNGKKYHILAKSLNGAVLVLPVEDIDIYEDKKAYYFFPNYKYRSDINMQGLKNYFDATNIKYAGQYINWKNKKVIKPGICQYSKTYNCWIVTRKCVLE